MANQARRITSQYPGSCLTCEEPYSAGDEVEWCPGVGCWHPDCDPPRNLATYVKDAASKKKFGH
jgi:hypothetical protein